MELIAIILLFAYEPIGVGICTKWTNRRPTKLIYSKSVMKSSNESEMRK